MANGSRFALSLLTAAGLAFTACAPAAAPEASAPAAPPATNNWEQTVAAAKKEGKPASRYLTKRNKKTVTERIEKKKYNPYLKRHTLHKEIK